MTGHLTGGHKKAQKALKLGSGVLVYCSGFTQLSLERGQAPLPDLFYSQLRKRRMELESENKTSQEEGLAPAG